MTRSQEDKENKIDLDQLKLWCSNLKTESKKEKLEKLQRISDFVTSDQVNEDNIEEIYNQIYLHLLQLYSDKSEVSVDLLLVSGITHHITNYGQSFSRHVAA